MAREPPTALTRCPRSDVVVIYVRDLGLTITQGAPRRLAGTARLYELQLFSE